jgi:hypothetical protein
MGARGAVVQDVTNPQPQLIHGPVPGVSISRNHSTWYLQELHIAPDLSSSRYPNPRHLLTL